MATPNFGAPYLAEGQASAWVTHNSALDVLDAALAAAGPAVSPAGVKLKLAVAEVVLPALSGASVTASALIPTRAIVLGVVSRVTTAVTGAASFDVGDAGDPSRFGGSLSVLLDGENVGVVGPYAIYAPLDVIVTANGGAFTGGAVRLTALFATVETPA